MADKLAVIQSDETVKELNLIEKEVEDLIADFKKLYDETLKITQAFGSGKPKDFAKSLEQMESVVKRINAVNEKTIQIGHKVEKVNLEAARARTANAKAIYEEERARQQAIKTQIQEESAKQKYIQTQSAEITLKNKLDSLDKKEQARLLAAASLYKKAEEALNSLRLRYNELAIQKQLGVQLNDREEKRMASLERAMKKYDTALKAVDATGGKYYRNVGNYASGYNSLGMSVAQVAREMPAFTNSIQTGLMGISNNLPILFDSLRAAKEQNAALRAEGKATIPVWKQLGSALLSWNTALSIGITLLTVYGKDIFEWAKGLFRANDALSILERNTKALNDARKEGVKSAASEINKLETLYRVATNENASREARIRSVNKLQSLYPSFFKNLSDEAIMVGNASAKYIELKNAILDSARARAIGNILEKRQEEQLQKEEEMRNRLNKVLDERRKLQKNINSSQSEYVSDKQGGLILKEVKNSELLARNTNLAYGFILQIGKSQKQFATENKSLLDEQFKLENKKNVLNLEGDRLGKGSGEPKTKQYSGAKLTGEQKDYLNSLQAEKDNALAIEKEKNLNLEIDNEEYLKRRIKIIQDYSAKIQNYLKGSNAKERQIEASIRVRAINDLSSAYKELYDIGKELLDESFQLQKKSIERQAQELEKNDYLTNSERLVEQIKLDGLIIAQTDEFYKKQIELAKNAGESTLEWERKRDEEVGKLQDERAKKLKNQFDAFKKDLDENAAFAESFTGRDYESERGKILTSNLSIKEKEYRLNLLDLKYNEDVLKIQKNNLQAELIKLKAKKETEGLTTIERNRYAEIERLIANINNQLIETGNNTEKIRIEKILDDFNNLKDVIINGFNDLGLNNFSIQLEESFSKLLDRTRNKTKDWIEYTKSGFLLLADFSSMLIDQEKQKRINALDEQLKSSQESTDLEIKFITDRIEWLNNLDTLSKEQISERNRLEDEARTLKEQQLQREKLIAAQKARAEQKAAAEQAFINGLVGAAKSIPNWAQVAASIAAGGLMAALIMSKDPVPQYFVGRERGPAEYAWTQEKGREIITDKNDNIKSLGSDKGPQMTWLEAGDKVLTADRTKEVLKRMGSLPKLGEKVFRKAAMQSLSAPVIVHTKTEDSSAKIAAEVGRQMQKALAKYDKPQIIKEKGKIKKYSGANLPVIIGEYDLKTGEEIWYQ